MVDDVYIQQRQSCIYTSSCWVCYIVSTNSLEDERLNYLRIIIHLKPILLTGSKQKSQNKSKSNKLDGSDSEMTNNSTVSVIDYIRNKKCSGSYRPDNRTKAQRQLLNEFEKPIQVYSYLALRQHYHPIFLNRNLSYTKKSKKTMKPSKQQNGNVQHVQQAAWKLHRAIWESSQHNQRNPTICGTSIARTDSFDFVCSFSKFHTNLEWYQNTWFLNLFCVKFCVWRLYFCSGVGSGKSLVCEM